MLGKQCCSICYWADKKGLISRRNGCFRVVKEKNLIKFLQEHPDSWDATKVTVKWMWEGQDWFDQKREADFQKMIKARWGEDAV